MINNLTNAIDIQVFKGNVYKQPPTKKAKKVITLDLDETIGSFSHLHILWNGIMRFYNKTNLNRESKDTMFFSLFDL